MAGHGVRARTTHTHTHTRSRAPSLFTGVLDELGRRDPTGNELRADVCAFVGKHPGGSAAVRAFHLLPHCKWDLVAFATAYNDDLDREIHPAENGVPPGHAVSLSGQRRMDDATGNFTRTYECTVVA